MKRDKYSLTVCGDARAGFFHELVEALPHSLADLVHLVLYMG